MPTWLSVTLCGVCILWAVAQARTFLVYMHVLRSAVLPTTESPQPALVHSALSDAITFACYGMIVLLIRWPKLVTYIIAVLLLKSLINMILASLGLGKFSGIELAPKGKRYQTLLESVPFIVYLLTIIGSALWLGY